MELTYWKYSEETKEVLKILEETIHNSERELIDFGGVMTSPYLDREYCRALGYIDGLNFLKRLIKEEENNDLA